MLVVTLAACTAILCFKKYKPCYKYADSSFLSVKGKFTVRLKALNQVGEQHVCNANQADREGTLRVKPTTFSSAFRINAEVLCHTCDCEKVRPDTCS